MSNKSTDFRICPPIPDSNSFDLIEKKESNTLTKSEVHFYLAGNSGLFNAMCSFSKFTRLEHSIFNLKELQIFKELGENISRDDWCIFFTDNDPTQAAHAMYVIAEPSFNYVAAVNPHWHWQKYSLKYTFNKDYKCDMDIKMQNELADGNVFEAKCFSLIECNLFLKKYFSNV